MLTACGGGAATPPSPATLAGRHRLAATAGGCNGLGAGDSDVHGRCQGMAAPMVQWQQSTDAGLTWTDINGATGPSFTTPATAMADSGERFRAVFTNAWP